MTKHEEAVTAAMNEIATTRKRMPMVRVQHDYRFEGPDGSRSLPELFDGRSQFVLYRFFFEEGVSGWPDAGCVGCSSFADGVPDLGLLHARDITFAMASPAPQANLRRYAERIGWTDVPWYTIGTERFSADFGVAEWFGLNVFSRRRRGSSAPISSNTGRSSEKDRRIGSTCSPSRRTAASPTTRTRRRAGRKRRASFWYRRHDKILTNRPRQPPAAIRMTSGRRLRSRALRAGRRSAS